MKLCKLSVLAKQDLKDIAIFTQQKWGREQRNSYLKQFDDSFRLLGENPDVGKACDELMQGYKKFPQGSHIIYYKRMNGYVLVIRILHKSMDVNPVTFGA
ncbi:type II toxin-antitoxin system RelE/ParE family toxin [Alteromonas sediminis]|uniref:Toxin n=1 Tax=Alteromonas sediminis TaxID=2259342 RepID=A0A3N5XZS2_9ALTE|nr:type II toxin-antitoxin system RelE/ParE family toxin [Alteromonas sediminis]RPJ66083.1 type II toxin-antitoxin system RelE/ParE family toxin [Alteromonas sediminis]